MPSRGVPISGFGGLPVVSSDTGGLGRRFWAVRGSHVDDGGCIDVGRYVTTARGVEVLETPLLNKGTAFTRQERMALGLEGLLPPAFLSLDEQAEPGSPSVPSVHGSLGLKLLPAVLSVIAGSAGLGGR